MKILTIIQDSVHRNMENVATIGTGAVVGTIVSLQDRLISLFWVFIAGMVGALGGWLIKIICNHISRKILKYFNNKINK